MRALIFNSGLGSRLGELTRGCPKCLVQLGSGETILHRQLRILSSLGVDDFIITTGPFAGMVEGEARTFEGRGCRFVFVRNERFAETNYIHSLWLARDELLGHDILMLHGDLVFDAGYAAELLALPAGSYGSIDPELPVPKKDFSADVGPNGFVRRVGVGISGDRLSAFQAMYRLDIGTMATWLEEVGRFEARGEVGVYAEDAANAVFPDMHVKAYSYTGHILEEIDTPTDLERVSDMIRLCDYAEQPTFVHADGGTELVEGSAAGRVVRFPRFGHVVADCGLAHPLVVADSFLSRDDLESLLGSVDWPTFSAFSPNPTYEQTLNAVVAFREGGCDSVVSVGGGSAIDVAKCVKLWAGLPGDGSGCDAGRPRYCDITSPFSDVFHVAVPMTAGTGSESTHFAVCYVDGSKRSVSADCLQPDVTLLIPLLLTGLPDYQRRATALDALCQAVESHWSIASSQESRTYSSRAIPAIVSCWDAYLAGDSDAARDMHVAANLAGRAINLTTTTAPHAMSYRLTSLTGIAHGHAVALCMGPVWRRLLGGVHGETRDRLVEIDALMTGDAGSPWGSGLEVFKRMLERTGLDAPTVGDTTLDALAVSVNVQRLANHPEYLDGFDLRSLYAEALGSFVRDGKTITFEE